MLRVLRETGFLLTDFAAACPGVNHSLIFHVLEKAELPDFNCRFLRRIYCNSTTHVEFAGRTTGHFLMARNVRRGCPASGFLFCNGVRSHLLLVREYDHLLKTSRS